MGKRRENRSLSSEEVHVSFGGTAKLCSLRNLSPSGCMIECIGLDASIDEAVEISFVADRIVQGQIAWKLGDSVGIFFCQPIQDELVRQYALSDWMLRSDWSLTRSLKMEYCGR